MYTLTLAVDVLDIKFYGKSTHASENAHEARNALDAMISYFNGVAQLRLLEYLSYDTFHYLDAPLMRYLIHQ